LSKEKPWILGISAAFHNGAACLIHGDEIVVAIQEERLSRIKHQAVSLDKYMLCVQYCLNGAGTKLEDLALIATTTIPFWGKEADDITKNPQLRVKELGIPVVDITHHKAHAISAYATSGFKESAVLVSDGGGNWGPHFSEEELAVAVKSDGPLMHLCEHLSLYYIDENGISPIEKHLGNHDYLVPDQVDKPYAWFTPGMWRFDSLGHMFSAAAAQIFGSPLQAGKVMGLSPYGKPTSPAEDLVVFKDGRFHFSDKLCEKFRHDERWPSHQEEYQNLSASVQVALEEALLGYVIHARELVDSDNLCYAGGVARL